MKYSVWGKFFVLVISTITLAFTLRFVNLTSIPIFADEAIYINWAQLIKSEPTLRFIPLSDGKQPLFMWVNWISLRFFEDPLVSGRMISVASGTLTVFIIGAFTYFLTKSKIKTLFAIALSATSPYLIFFDRLAVVDSLLALLALSSMLLLYLSQRYKRFDLAILSGLSLGLALITKSPAVFFLPLCALTIFENFNLKKKKKVIIYETLVSTLRVGICIFFAISLYQVLRLGPGFEQIGSRNLDYIRPIGEVLANPKDTIVNNLVRAYDWLFKLLPVPTLVLSAIGLFVGLKNKNTRIVSLFMFVWFSASLFVTSAITIAYTARYILFAIPPLFILASFAINPLKKFSFSYLLAIISIVYGVYFANNLWNSPEKAVIPENERAGYLEEWSAGYGIYEAANHIKSVRAATNQGIVLGTEGHFGTMPDGFKVYLSGLQNVTIFGIGLDVKGVRSDLVNAKRTGNIVFLALNESRKNKDFKEDGLKLIMKVEKPMRTRGSHDYITFGPRDTFYLYEVMDANLVQFIQ